MAVFLYFLLRLGYPLKGLGIDFGLVFANDRLNHEGGTKSPTNYENNQKIAVCEISEKVLMTVYGTCSYFSACTVEETNYFGSQCSALQLGHKCNVETEKFLTVQEGSCLPGGHCKGPQGEIRLPHEACRDTKHSGEVKRNRTKLTTVERRPQERRQSPVTSPPPYSKCLVLIKTK